MKPKVRLTGDWARAQQVMAEAPRRIPAAMRKAILQEAHFLRGKMLGPEGIKNPAMKPLSAWTIATGRKGSRPLHNTGNLRNSIGVIQTAMGAFVGVRRSAPSKYKGTVVNLALIHENGATIRQVVTTKQHKFFQAMLIKMKGHPGGAPKPGDTLTIRIPARPFISPVLDRYVGRNGEMLRPRLKKRFAKALAPYYREL